MSMLVREVLAARYSCRGFTPEPVTREQIQAVVTAASRAPACWM